MEETITKEVREGIQKLWGFYDTCTGNDSMMLNLDKKLRYLEGTLNFLSNLKMEERSRLKYFRADLLEMAQDLMDVEASEGMDSTLKLKEMEIEIEKTMLLMGNFRANKKNVEEEEEVEVVVGLEKVVHNLLKKIILTKNKRLCSLAIKGMIGIGKSTLARQIYNHKAVADRFDYRGWVSISSDMSYKEVLVELIQQMVVGSEELIGRDYLLEEKDNRSLRQILRQRLQGKQIFIVFENLFPEMLLSRILQHLQGLSLLLILH